MRTAPLRFALLSAGTSLAQWQANCLERLLATPDVELALLITDARSSRRPKRWYQRWTALRHSNVIGWELYRRYLARRLASLRTVDMSERFAGVPRMDVQAIRKGKYSDYFPPESIALIREHALDFMLLFAFNILRGEILNTACYGVWSFHHDDLDKYRGCPSCFWEVYHGDRRTGVTLQRLTEKLDGGVVLRKESFATCLGSFQRNLELGLQFGASWPAEACRRILADDTDFLERPPSSTKAPIYRRPTNLQMLRLLWKTTASPHWKTRPARS